MAKQMTHCGIVWEFRVETNEEQCTCPIMGIGVLQLQHDLWMRQPPGGKECFFPTNIRNIQQSHSASHFSQIFAQVAKFCACDLLYTLRWQTSFCFVKCNKFTHFFFQDVHTDMSICMLFTNSIPTAFFRVEPVLTDLGWKRVNDRSVEVKLRWVECPRHSDFRTFKEGEHLVCPILFFHLTMSAMPIFDHAFRNVRLPVDDHLLNQINFLTIACYTHSQCLY